MGSTSIGSNVRPKANFPVRSRLLNNTPVLDYASAWRRTMLTPQQNERLTRVGPGTPGGELMRRYWHPILPEIKLADNPVQKVRILGEDLILYRDREGGLGLVARRCPHRSFDMQFGIPEN